jgi:hypothetical protein
MKDWKNWNGFNREEVNISKRICGILDQFLSDLKNRDLPRHQVLGNDETIAMAEILGLATQNLNTFNHIGLTRLIFILANISSYTGGLHWVRNNQGRAFEDAWIQAARPMLAQFNAQNLANSIWALATLGHHNQEFIDAWIDAARPRLGEFSAQDLVNIILALATLNHHDQEFEDTWIDAARPMLGQFTPQNLAASIGALARLNHHDQAFEDAWIRLAQTILDQFSVENLADIIWALNALNHHDQAFDNAWMEAAQPMLDQFNLLDFYHTGAAMIRNNNLREEQFVRAWGEALQSLIGVEQDPDLLQMVIRIANLLGVHILPPKLQAEADDVTMDLLNDKDDEDGVTVDSNQNDKDDEGPVANINATQDIFTPKKILVKESQALCSMQSYFNSCNESIANFSYDRALNESHCDLQQPLSGLSENWINYNFHYSM